MRWIDKRENKTPNLYFTSAKYDADDEFYTSYNEIAKELKEYRHYFKDKTIICPCNDGLKSNFFRYFTLNFNDLEIKKVITTTFEINNKESLGTKIEITSDNIIQTKLKGNGDFRSDEVKEIIKSGDIVVTNPPFTIIRDLVKICIDSNKKFLIVGGIYVLTYKYINKLFNEKKLWLGKNQVTTFTRPNESKKRINNIGWLTNLMVDTTKPPIILNKSFNPQEYKEYDNYKALEISRNADIPKDYDGVMGVSISFFRKHNKAQFEILGVDYEIKDKYPELLKDDFKKFKTLSPILDGKETFSRIFIRKKTLSPQQAVINHIN